MSAGRRRISSIVEAHLSSRVLPSLARVNGRGWVVMERDGTIELMRNTIEPQLAHTQTSGTDVLSALVASALRELRQAASYSQEEVARFCKVTTWTVNRWESTNAPMPRPRHRRQLAKLYNVTVAELGLE
jgi:DNA-binding transcriptional regulator YiaG